MANYSIVVDTSNFKPYDMSIPLNILRDYREAYYRYEDALNKIAEENGMYSLPEPEEGNYEQRRIYDLYQKYNNEFRSVTDDFAKGMNWRNAQMVRDINRRYGLEVKPVKQAVENYNKFLENKNSIRANRPEARFGKNPSVYDFVGGRTPELEMLDGEKIQATAAKLFTGVYNSSLHKDPQFKQSIIEGYDLMYKEGIPEKEALLLAMTKYNERTGGQHSKALNNYMTVLNNYFDSLGIEGWDESEKLKVWGDIINGAVSAIPERKEELVVKKDLERALQRLQMQLARSEEARKALMHPLLMSAERAKVLGQMLNNQALRIANKYASSNYQRQARMDDLNYKMLWNEYNELYGDKDYSPIFSNAVGKNNKIGKLKGDDDRGSRQKYLTSRMDNDGVIHAGRQHFVYVHEKDKNGNTVGKFYDQNGKTYTSSEVQSKVVRYENSTKATLKNSDKTQVSYNSMAITNPNSVQTYGLLTYIPLGNGLAVIPGDEMTTIEAIKASLDAKKKQPTGSTKGSRLSGSTVNIDINRNNNRVNIDIYDDSGTFLGTKHGTVDNEDDLLNEIRITYPEEYQSPSYGLTRRAVGVRSRGGNRTGIGWNNE